MWKGFIAFYLKQKKVQVSIKLGLGSFLQSMLDDFASRGDRTEGSEYTKRKRSQNSKIQFLSSSPVPF